MNNDIQLRDICETPSKELVKVICIIKNDKVAQVRFIEDRSLRGRFGWFSLDHLTFIRRDETTQA